MVHRHTKEKYQAAGVEYTPNPQDIAEADFFRATARTPGGLKTKINHIWRRRIGNKEVLEYDMHLVGLTSAGAKRTYHYDRGVWPNPRFVQTIDENTGKMMFIAKQEEIENIRDIPYTPQNVQEIFGYDQFGTNTAMSITVGTDLEFQVFDRDAFINLPFDELCFRVTGRRDLTSNALSENLVSTSVRDSQVLPFETNATPQIPPHLGSGYENIAPTVAGGGEVHSSFGRNPNALVTGTLNTDQAHASFGPQVSQKAAMEAAQQANSDPLNQATSIEELEREIARRKAINSGSIEQSQQSRKDRMRAMREQDTGENDQVNTKREAQEEDNDGEYSEQAPRGGVVENQGILESVSAVVKNEKTGEKRRSTADRNIVLEEGRQEQENNKNAKEINEIENTGQEESQGKRQNKRRQEE